VIRRHALRALLAGATAAIGAALIGSDRPGRASANGPTTFTSGTSAVPVTAENTAGYNAILAEGSGGGFYGTVYATNSSISGVAVYAGADGSGAYAVQGVSMFGYGVVGYGGTASLYGYTNSSDGIGVLGTNISSMPAIQAVNYGSGFGLTASGAKGGVLGSATGNAAGVYGTNTSGPGVYGMGPASSAGVVGACVGGGPGVFAYNSAGGAGIVGQSASGQAGIFLGPVTVTGVLTVMGAKSAAVRDSAGTLRRLYSLESPESWFEDFGSGQLSAGNASVHLDPGFAGVVKSDDYHVFLTPRGESKGWLYVSKQSPNGFTVQEAGGGTSGIGFSYRVVARRRDIAGARLEHVAEPPDPAQMQSLLPAAVDPPPQPKQPGTPPARPPAS
jgi:hypothetical protein